MLVESFQSLWWSAIPARSSASTLVYFFGSQQLLCPRTLDIPALTSQSYTPICRKSPQVGLARHIHIPHIYVAGAVQFIPVSVTKSFHPSVASVWLTSVASPKISFRRPVFQSDAIFALIPPIPPITCQLTTPHIDGRDLRSSALPTPDTRP